LPIKRRGLTEFTYSRFLCPWMCKHLGTSLFLDADMLVLCDIAELFAWSSHEYDIQVVTHQPRYEWASMMLFSNPRCKTLDPKYVEENNYLFEMKWARNIGQLPKEYNYCVGYADKCDAKIVHYTQGIPYFSEVGNCDYAAEWWQEYERMKSSVSWSELMGNSVHAKHVKANVPAAIAN
jgi:lipopolysaccharide biosynthesis glycosyltransferase